MTKNIIYILVAGVAVYFLFFYKKDKETTATTPTTPTGGGTSGGGGSATTGTTAPPWNIGETRLKLKAGKFAYDAVEPTPTKLYENRTGTAQLLGGVIEYVGTYNGQRGYILKFQSDSLLPSTAPSYRRRAFYESDLII